MNEKKQVLADQKYWRDFAPPGWKLIAFTYRQVADFALIEDGRIVDKIEVTSRHVEFIEALISSKGEEQ